MSRGTADECLQMLIEGNNRFESGNSSCVVNAREDMIRYRTHQNPIAVVVGCSDSRVPPEIIFDLGIGELFVIRIAGNVLDNNALGCIEYGVEHLKVPLVVILGHKGCGAVSATVGGGIPEGKLASIVKCISPAVEKAKGMSGDLFENSVVENVKNSVKIVDDSEPVLKKKKDEGKMIVLGAVYSWDTGKVEFLK